MAFTNEDVQEIKEIVLETIAEESDPIENVQQVSELSNSDEVPIVRSSQGVNSYGRASVNLFRGVVDKDYNPAEFSGLGNVYLKKNIVEVDGVEKNILIQSAFYKENTQTPNTDTVFVVQYDFDLNGETITMPANCTLEFEGGSIKNGFCYGNNTRLIGRNSYKGVLVGLFVNENNQVVDGTGDIVCPNIGWDFAAMANRDVDYIGNFAHAQGIIHTGQYIFVLCSNNDNNSLILRYDNFFNYYGLVFLSESQIEHGGQGFYKDGYIYVASHKGSYILKYNVNDIINASVKSTIQGTVIPISGTDNMNIMFLCYDYNTRTHLISDGINVSILDENYNVIISRESPQSNRTLYALQDIKWTNGMISFTFCDWKYKKRLDSLSVYYYDIYSNTVSDIYRIEGEYNGIELEASCNYIDSEGVVSDDVYVVCGFHAELSSNVIGKYSNTKKVDTLSTNMQLGSGEQINVYVDNTIKAIAPYGTSENPYKNIISAFFFDKGKSLVINFKDVSQNYNTPYNIYKYVTYNGTSNAIPTIVGTCRILYGGTLSTTYTKHIGRFELEKGTLLTYHTTIDSQAAKDSSVVCINAGYNSKVYLNVCTLKNAATGVRLNNSDIFAHYTNMYFENIGTLIVTVANVQIYAPYLYLANFTDVDTYIDTGQDRYTTLRFRLYGTTSYDALINFLDKCREGTGIEVFCYTDYLDRPYGFCTFMHKDKIGDTKGTLVGPNGSTLPITLSTEVRTSITRKLRVGDHTFDTDLDKEVYWRGEKWTDAVGNNLNEFRFHVDTKYAASNDTQQIGFGFAPFSSAFEIKVAGSGSFAYRFNNSGDFGAYVTSLTIPVGTTNVNLLMAEGTYDVYVFGNYYIRNVNHGTGNAHCYKNISFDISQLNHSPIENMWTPGFPATGIFKPYNVAIVKDMTFNSFNANAAGNPVKFDYGFNLDDFKDALALTQIYARDVNAIGSIESLGKSLSLSNINCSCTSIQGEVTELARMQVENGRESGILMLSLIPTNCTLNGNPITYQGIGNNWTMYVVFDPNETAGYRIQYTAP